MDERLIKSHEKGMSMRYRAFRWTMNALGWLLFGFTVHGAEKVPGQGALIVASNHRRYADPVFVSMAVPRRLWWMAKKEVFVGPLGRFFYFIGSFPVDREKGGRAALKAAISLLSDGWALGIFPEGTRRKSYDPDAVPKSGVGMLAARGNSPILPVFVGRVPNPLERFRGKRLHVYIGDPITLDGKEGGGGRAYKGFAREVLREIYTLSEGGAS